jgi:hypothetical protein
MVLERQSGPRPVLGLHLRPIQHVAEFSHGLFGLRRQQLQLFVLQIRADRVEDLQDLVQAVQAAETFCCRRFWEKIRNPQRFNRLNL